MRARTEQRRQTDLYCVEEYGILECNTVQFGEILTFQRNISPSSSRSIKRKPIRKQQNQATSKQTKQLTNCEEYRLRFFDPEDERDMFLRKIRLSPIYTALQLRRSSFHSAAVRTSNPISVRFSFLSVS
jgi:hypothetical protein